jgi:predicted nucleotidyltransferase
MQLIEKSATLFGLKPEVIEKINSVFANYSDIEKAVLYGSRAKGNYRQGSDIDITLMGIGLTYNQLLKIATDIDDLLLPYKIDLSIYQQISNPDLVTHIERVGQQFYSRLDKYL